mgnify:FL=1
MKAILLAGGQGRRLRSITGKLPKPLVPLVGVPVLDRLLELLRRSGFTDVCATLCYQPETIQEHCGDGSSYGVHLRYRIETEPRGTAGAVRACSDFYGRDDFLVISGDAACSFDLLQLYRQHQSSGAAVTVALYPDAEPLQYGLVLQDRQGYVRHFIEKPDWPHVVTDLVNTGIYIVSPRAMTYVPEDTPFDFANDLFPLLLAANEPILGVPMDGYWCDIGTPRAYYRCCLDVLDGRLSPAPPEAPEAPDAPVPCADPLRRSVPCRDRAHRMRTLSEAMMEAGADFTNGLHVRDGSWELTVRPDAEVSALQVEANIPDAAAETARLLELMEQREK